MVKPSNNSPILVGVKRAGPGGRVPPGEEGGCAIQVIWVKIGDVYLSSNEHFIVGVKTEQSADPMKVFLELCPTSFATVDFDGPDAPPEFRAEFRR